jgi:hypothetical protein
MMLKIADFYNGAGEWAISVWADPINDKAKIVVSSGYELELAVKASRLLLTNIDNALEIIYNNIHGDSNA